jgi:hypothetical protein
MLIHSAEITGSVQFNNTDVSGITNVSSFATTASVDAVVIKTGSFATTSSVNELQSKTGSYTSTSSFGAYSSSINTFTSSATTRLSTIESVTGSFASTSSVNNLQSVTGSYASTGSNQFNGNQSISGSITSNGTITAQTLVVQTVTSSVEFVTGSTRNGSIAENTHQFTGSVLMTGSLTVNKVAINAGNLTLSNFPTLDLIISGGIGFTSGGGASALIDRDGSGNITFYGSSGDIKFTDVAMTSNYLTIKNAGNVGIGTSSPNKKLEVAIGSDAFRISRASAGEFDMSIDTSGNIIYSTTIGAGQIFNTNGGSERMRITSAGSVGIGTASPTGTYGKLSVAGGISTLADNNSKLEIGRYSSGVPSSYIKLGANSDSLRITNNTDVADIFIITNSGSVGIGTTSPNSTLHVNGGGTAGTRGIISEFRNISNSQRIDIRDEVSSTQQPPGLYSPVAGYGLGLYATAGPMVFYTNGNVDANERMRINVNGQVTLPYQPAFYAYYTAGAGTATTGAFTGFNSTRVNRGSHYNTSNGRFTAPIAGVYEFIFSALWRQSTATGAGEISIGLNGANINARGIGYVNFNVGNNGHAQILTKVILSLSANDYVTAWIHTAGTSPSDWYYGENLGYFCGTLIG